MVLRRLLAAVVVGPLTVFTLAMSSAAEWQVTGLSADTKVLPNRWVSPCDPTIWFQDRVQERGEPIMDAQCGDLRGDGVIRMYAHLGQSHQYIELENTPEGPHAVKDIFNARAFVPLVTFGLGSNAPKPSIFMSEGVRVREIFWNGTTWTTRLIESSYDHIPRGLVAADIRRDGKRHLFGDCTEFLMDYALEGGKWTATKYRIRPKYKYTKSTFASVGEMPGIGRGIVVRTDTDNEFIVWSPEASQSEGWKKYMDKLRKLAPRKNGQ